MRGDISRMSCFSKEAGAVVREPLESQHPHLPRAKYMIRRGDYKYNYYVHDMAELYNLREDPMQWRNLWDDPAYAKLKSDLRADLYDNLPPERNPKLPVEAPA